MKVCVGAVLIVDDTELNLRLAEALLRPYQLAVDTVMSGREAIERIRGGNVYDIIFMDHMMPDMDGIETTAAMRGLGYTYPIIALTAIAETEQAEIFMENGFDGCIGKPIEMSRMNGLLHKYVRDIAPGDDPGPARISGVMARSFVRDAQKAAAALEELHRDGACGDAGLRRYTTIVHGMKSALANVWEHELSDAALRLENAGRSKDLAVITAGTPAFIDGLRAVIDKLGAREAEDDGGEAPDADSAYLYGQLDVIIEACGIYDKKTVKALLAGLRQTAWPRPVIGRLDDMADRLLTGDYDEIAHIAGEIIGAK